jgi:succinate-semialdehyde dehydrogenase/glutarate-semialdehyde dehydrogenase
MPAPSAEVFDRLRQVAAIEDVTARPSRTIDEVFTGKLLTTIPVGTAADVEAAFAEARAAQIEWAKRPVTERIGIVRRYRDLVVENREFLMDLLQAEAGRPGGRRRRKSSI